MKATDYPVMLTWSKEDKAYLARVVHLPGCMADGKTKLEALENVGLAIAEWIETVKEMGFPVPPPIDDAALEAQTLKNDEEQAQRLQHEVQKEVEKALSRIVPEIVKQVASQLPLQSPGAFFRFRSPSRPVTGKSMAPAGKV